LDELGEVPNQIAIEDFLNNQRALNRNCVSKELSSPSFAAEHIVDLQQCVVTIY